VFPSPGGPRNTTSSLTSQPDLCVLHAGAHSHISRVSDVDVYGDVAMEFRGEVGHDRLRQLVQDKLELEWSPEQIAQHLRHAYSDRLDWHLCHETITRPCTSAEAG
jgi:hypothetical protein